MSAVMNIPAHCYTGPCVICRRSLDDFADDQDWATAYDQPRFDRERAAVSFCPLHRREAVEYCAASGATFTIF